MGIKSLYTLLVVNEHLQNVNYLRVLNLEEYEIEPQLRIMYKSFIMEHLNAEYSYCIIKQSKRIAGNEQQKYYQKEYIEQLPLSSLRYRYKDIHMLHIWITSVFEDNVTYSTGLFARNVFLDAAIEKRIEIADDVSFSAKSSKFGILLTRSALPIGLHRLGTPPKQLFEIPFDRQAFFDTFERLRDPCNISLLLEQPVLE